MIVMFAFLSAWILASSIWTLFCIFDCFRGWIEFREWKATVHACKRESAVLLSLLIREVHDARERMRCDRCPRHVDPRRTKGQTEHSDRGDAHRDPS